MEKTSPLDRPAPYRHGEKPLHECLRLHARERSDATAYLWYGRALSWRWLDDASDAFAAVLGVPDATRGEAVKAFVVRRPGMRLEAGELIAWARENMSVYKAPREVAFRDALPATGSGKVLRRLLGE